MRLRDRRGETGQSLRGARPNSPARPVFGGLTKSLVRDGDKSDPFEILNLRGWAGGLAA